MARSVPPVPVSGHTGSIVTLTGPTWLKVGLGGTRQHQLGVVGGGPSPGLRVSQKVRELGDRRGGCPRCSCGLRGRGGWPRTVWPPGPPGCRVERVRDRRAHLCELDDLAGTEAQLLVVVQHRVHILNPDGVHGPVEHIPLLVGVGHGGPLPDEGGEDPVCPAATKEGRAVGAGVGVGGGARRQAQLAPKETCPSGWPCSAWFLFWFWFLVFRPPTPPHSSVSSFI